MENFNHSINELFDQLGLASSDEDISEFIKTHQLDRSTPIEKADFWLPHQVEFIVSSKLEDADWIEPIDDLSALLYKTAMNQT